MRLNSKTLNAVAKMLPSISKLNIKSVLEAWFSVNGKKAGQASRRTDGGGPRGGGGKFVKAKK